MWQRALIIPLSTSGSDLYLGYSKDNSAVFLITGFLAFVSTPVVLLLFLGQNDVSETEKRRLRQIPLTPLMILSDSGRHEFEESFKDQYGLRDQLTGVHNCLKFTLLGVSPNPKVILGKDGWLFYNSNRVVEDMTHGNLLSPAELSDWMTGFIAKREWLKAQGVEYLFVIAPNKHGIHKDKLKFRMGASRRRIQLTDALRDRKVDDFLDLYEPLSLEAKKERLYWKTDTHWNDWGANIAQYELMMRIAERFPGKVTPLLHKKSEFLDKKSTSGDLAQMIGMRGRVVDSGPIFNGALDFDSTKLSSGIPHDLKPDVPVTITKSHTAAKLRILCFRDSFFNNMIQYISSHSVDVTYVWLPNPTRYELDYWVDRTKPDIVIEERVERSLPAQVKFSMNTQVQE